MDTRSDGRSASRDRDGSGGPTQNPEVRGLQPRAGGDEAVMRRCLADGANELASGIGFAALDTFGDGFRSPSRRSRR